MTTVIPKTSDLAAALVAHAGANEGHSMLLASLIVDEAARANAAGTPKPMLDFVNDAKRAYPMMFASTATTAPAGDPIHRGSRPDDAANPWAMTARVARSGNAHGLDPDVLAAMARARGMTRPLGD